MPPSEEFWTTPLAFAIVAGAAGAVIGPLFFWVRGRRLLPMQRLRRGNWSGREVWLAFMLLFLVPLLTVNLLDNLGFYEAIFDNKPTYARMGLWAWPLATLLTLALLFWVFFQTSRTRPSYLGLTCTRWPQNIVLGYLWFLILTPLVLGLYIVILVLYWWALGSLPEDHMLTRLSQESLTDVEWALLIGEATLAAPLLEELLLRGVLQGWLRRASFPGHIMLIVVTLGWVLAPLLNSLFPLPDQPAGDVNAEPLVFAILMAVGYAFALNRVWRNGEQKNVVLAIFGSAMVFAVLHSQVWPTPIPLFFLGIGLGYLAYRTQSLLPGILVHGLFNAVTCVQLVLKQTGSG